MKWPAPKEGCEFIYGLVDPRDRKEIRYVGRTTLQLGYRLCAHYGEMRKQPHWGKSKWLMDLRVVGVRAEIYLLEEVPRDQAATKERGFAQQFAKTCRLLNARYARHS